MRNRLYLCAATLLAGMATAAAQSASGCVAGDTNPSSINARCSTDGLPAVSKPLPNDGNAVGADPLDERTTSSVTDSTAPGSQSNMPMLDVPSHSPGTGGDGGLSGSSGSAISDTQGNADISGGTSMNNRVGGSAITGTSGISTGSGEH